MSKPCKNANPVCDGTHIVMRTIGGSTWELRASLTNTVVSGSCHQRATDSKT